VSNAVLQIDIVPSQRKQLTSAHSSFEGEHDQGLQIAITPTFACIKQSLLFSVFETAIATSG
jgi:hypothetical protein